MSSTATSRRENFNKPAFFADLGYEPHAGQAEIHASDHPRRVVACGVRWGKSRCASMEGLAGAMEPKDRSVGWICAPTYQIDTRWSTRHHQMNGGTARGPRAIARPSLRTMLPNQRLMSWVEAAGKPR